MLNYQPTSNASGIIQAPKEARYFIQRMSRQGKSEGRWIFVSKLNKNNGSKSKKAVDTLLGVFEMADPDSSFRVQLAEVFI